MEFHTDPASASDLTLARFEATKSAATLGCYLSGAVALLAGIAWLWTQFEPRRPKASANPAQAPD